MGVARHSGNGCKWLANCPISERVFSARVGEFYKVIMAALHPEIDNFNN